LKILQGKNPMVKKISLFIFMVALLDNLTANSYRAVTDSNNGCWTEKKHLNTKNQDIAFSELDEKLVFFFKDDISCKNISQAIVRLNGVTKKADWQGRVEFPIEVIENVEDGRTVQLIAYKSGYEVYRVDLEVMAGSLWKHKFVMSKSLAPKQMKFVLEWSEKPRDLDLHLKTSNYHIFYGNKNNSGGKANLDRDDVSSFGPETITLKNIEFNKEYELYVNIYSPRYGRLNGNNRATVSVYKNEKLDKVITIQNNKKRKIPILKITKNSELKYIYK
jgi:hypothetical protein